MLVAVISDVHGNHVALDAIEKDLRRVLVDYGRDHFDRIWLLGDLIDPLPGSVEVIRRIRGWCGQLLKGEPELVAGNHEGYVFGLVPLDGATNPLFQRTIPVTRRRLQGTEGTDEYRWLSDHCTVHYEDSDRRLCTRRLLGGDDLGHARAAVWLCHGMLRDYMEWSYHLPEGREGAIHAREDMEHARRQPAGADVDRCLILCGHSHRAFAWHRGRPGDQPQPVGVVPGEWVAIGEGDYVVCVGSAGADRRPASDAGYHLEYVLLDIGERQDFAFQVRRIVLNREWLRQELGRACLRTYDPATTLEVLQYFRLTLA